jgi:hypothetical protein
MNSASNQTFAYEDLRNFTMVKYFAFIEPSVIAAITIISFSMNSHCLIISLGHYCINSFRIVIVKSDSLN